MHTDQSQAQRLGVRNAADRHHGVCRRDIRPAHQLEQRRAGVRRLHAAAVVNNRTFGLRDHPGNRFQLLGGHVIGLMHFDLGSRNIFALGACDILRDIDQHRAGSAGRCDAECTADGIRQFIHMPYDEIVLGDRHGDTGDVNLLKGISPDQAGTDVAGDGNHRNGVHVCRCDARDQIGRARAACCQTHANLTGGAGIAVRRVGCALFVGS